MSNMRSKALSRSSDAGTAGFARLYEHSAFEGGVKQHVLEGGVKTHITTVQIREL